MAAELVLPQLREWAQGHSISLLEANTVPLFDTAFEYFFARELNVTINGERITRDEYRGTLISYGGFPDQPEDVRGVQFAQILDVPFYDPEFNKAGVVGLMYNATYGSSSILGSLHLIINRMADVCPRPSALIRGYCDPRRVVDVNHIIRNTTQSIFG